MSYLKNLYKLSQSVIEQDYTYTVEQAILDIINQNDKENDKRNDSYARIFLFMYKKLRDIVDYPFRVDNLLRHQYDDEEEKYEVEALVVEGLIRTLNKIGKNINFLKIEKLGDIQNGISYYTRNACSEEIKRTIYKSRKMRAMRWILGDNQDLPVDNIDPSHETLDIDALLIQNETMKNIEIATENFIRTLAEEDRKLFDDILAFDYKYTDRKEEKKTTNQNRAQELGISEKTVRNRKKRLKLKFLEYVINENIINVDVALNYRRKKEQEKKKKIA